MKNNLRLLFSLGAAFVMIPSVNAEAEETNSTSSWLNEPVSEEEENPITPWAAISLDYLATSNGGYGLTVSANHYDEYFPNWGYYGGYARLDNYEFGDARDFNYKYDRSMFRIGISYSFTNDFSWYGGAVYANDKGEPRAEIVNPCVDCESRQETHQNQWGGEMGFRYAYKNLLLGVGFDSVNRATMFSIGYRGN